MVKITNGIDVFEVSVGAYEGIYARQGYKVVKENDSKEVESKVPAKSDDEVFFEDVVEKPISQWNKNEVKRFATLKGIDISGTKNANEAKAIIKEFLDAAEEFEESEE